MDRPVNYLDWTIAQLAGRLWDVAMAYNEAENEAATHDRFGDHIRANAATDAGAQYLDESNAIKAELERRSKHLGVPDARAQVCPMCGYDPDYRHVCEPLYRGSDVCRICGNRID